MNPYSLDVYLRTLAGRASDDEFLEMRRRVASGSMVSEFFRVRQMEQLGASLQRNARRTDVYVGCAPRIRRAGTKDAIDHVWTLWAECDGQSSVDALLAYDPSPAIIIGSGSGANCHAYWPLIEPLTAPEAEATNLRLAVAIGADAQCFDASRILRPPGSWNHKHQPPAKVRTLRLDISSRFEAMDVIRHAPPIDTQRIERRWRPEPARTSHGDPLLRIPPDVYVTNLLGRTPGRNRKVTCPFHSDSRPSLHAFPTPERGWHCFGCGRGGTIYDLAAGVWGMGTRGSEFVELRRKLLDRFAPELRHARQRLGLERT